MTRPPIVDTVLLILACIPAAHMAGIVIWDVILRYLLNEAPGMEDFDIVHRDFAWAVMLACGAALVWRHESAATSEPGWRPRTWQRITGAIVALGSALAFAALAVVAVRKLNTSIETGEVGEPGKLPLWPLRLAPVVGFALAALLFIYAAIRSTRATPANGRDGTP
jgi:TRAP-type C4-dicarboxylate transport system permease small subunit